MAYRWARVGQRGSGDVLLLASGRFCGFGGSIGSKMSFGQRRAGKGNKNEKGESIFNATIFKFLLAKEEEISPPEITSPVSPLLVKAIGYLAKKIGTAATNSAHKRGSTNQTLKPLTTSEPSFAVPFSVSSTSILSTPFPSGDV